MSATCVGAYLANQSTLTTSQPRRAKARSMLPVPQKSTSARIFPRRTFFQLMSRAGSTCFPRTLLGTFSGGLVLLRVFSAFCLARFISCHSLAHFLRCSCQVVIFCSLSFWAMFLAQATSSRSCRVAREHPIYICLNVICVLSVSSRTRPGKVNP